jgi:4-hydroxy-tetrahydrodipicolinate synthase
MANKPVFSGVIAPVLTPFAEDGAPDADRFIDHAEWLLENGCSGLAPFGTTSEANSLGLDERLELLEDLVDAGVEPVKLMPGTGMCSVTDAAILTQHAVDLGCGGVLMLPPFYYKNPSEEGLFRFFADVIDEVGDDRLRVYLYHIPPVSQVGFSVALTRRLKNEFPGVIVGMKDSSGDWNNTKVFLDAFAKTGFDVFVGSESFLLANMRHHGVGTISATANVNPAAIHKLFTEWKNADADAQQAALNVTRDAFGKKYLMIAALKQGIAIYANDPGWGKVRPPLVDLNAEQAKSLEVELKAIGFTMPGLKRAGAAVAA